VLKSTSRMINRCVLLAGEGVHARDSVTVQEGMLTLVEPNKTSPLHPL
jgi:hypothetical protein